MSIAPSGKVIQAALGILVSVGLVIWIILSFEWSAVWSALDRAVWWHLLPLSAVFLLHYCLRAIRWTYLLPAGVKFVPFKERLEPILVGTFASFILPLRAGEFVRPMLLARAGYCSFPVALSSVVIERFFDLSMVLISFAAIALSGAEFPAWVMSGALILGTLALILLTMMVLCAVVPGVIRSTVQFFCQWLPQKFAALLLRIVDEFLRGVSVIKDRRRLGMVVLYTLLVWGTCFWSFAEFQSLLGIAPSVAFATTTGVIVALAVAAPSAPGFIGVYQVAFLAAGRLFGLDDSVSLALAIVSHVYQYIFFCAYGAWFLVRTGLSLGDLKQRSGEAVG